MKLKARLHFLDAFHKLANLHPKLRFEGPIVCAVSGGIDSVCLLSLATELAEPLAITPIVAHLNHGVRSAAEKDQIFVRNLAKQHNLRFFSEKLGEPPLGKNLEAWMREGRYQFLERVKDTVGAKLILTAHHAGDQDETLLMHLLTNRLPKHDSAGIRFFDEKRSVFRPLLGCTKEDLESYARDRELSWVEDETNLDSSFLRNRVRREILPFLRETLNPNVSEALRLLAERIGSDEEFISAKFPNVAELVTPIGGESSEQGLPLRPLISMPIAARWRLLRDFLELTSPQVADRVSFNRLFSVAESLGEYPDKLVVFELGDGVSLELVSGGLLAVRINRT